MFISRIELDLGNNDTRQAIASPHKLHAAVENCFHEKNRTLWRLDRIRCNLYMLLVSAHKPCFDGFSEQFCSPGETGETKSYEGFLSSIKNGQKLRFRLCGNPVHSVGEPGAGRGKVKPHASVRYKKEWLVKKSGKHGFALEENQFEIVETGVRQFGKKGSKSQIRISQSVFEGVLTVTDRELLALALISGIGRAKAYGCGLITVMTL